MHYVYDEERAAGLTASQRPSKDIGAPKIISRQGSILSGMRRQSSQTFWKITYKIPVKSVIADEHRADGEERKRSPRQSSQDTETK